MMDIQAFGARLKQARKAMGMTQMEVAEELRTTVHLIMKYEKGYRKPGICRAAELAELYEVSLDWLCGMDGGKKDENA